MVVVESVGNLWLPALLPCFCCYLHGLLFLSRCSTIFHIPPNASQVLNDLSFCWVGRDFTISFDFLAGQTISLGLWSCWVLKSTIELSSGHSVGVGCCPQCCGHGYHALYVMTSSSLVVLYFPNSAGLCPTKEDARRDPRVATILSADTTAKEKFDSFPTF